MILSIKIFDKVPARFNVALMMFLACWVNYMMRVNMSVNIIAMVPDETTTTSVKSECKAIVTNDSSLFNASTTVVTRHVLRQVLKRQNKNSSCKNRDHTNLHDVSEFRQNRSTNSNRTVGVVIDTLDCNTQQTCVRHDHES